MRRNTRDRGPASLIVRSRDMLRLSGGAPRGAEGGRRVAGARPRVLTAEAAGVVAFVLAATGCSADQARVPSGPPREPATAGQRAATTALPMRDVEFLQVAVIGHREQTALLYREFVRPRLLPGPRTTVPRELAAMADEVATWAAEQLERETTAATAASAQLRQTGQAAPVEAKHARAVLGSASTGERKALLTLPLEQALELYLGIVWRQSVRWGLLAPLGNGVGPQSKHPEVRRLAAEVRDGSLHSAARATELKSRLGASAGSGATRGTRVDRVSAPGRAGDAPAAPARIGTVVRKR